MCECGHDFFSHRAIADDTSLGSGYVGGCAVKDCDCEAFREASSEGVLDS